MRGSLGPNKTSVRYLTVGNNHAGRRIDNVLASELKGLPRNRIYRMLRKGEVRVNRSRVQQSYRLKAGDVVRIPPVLTRVREPQCQAPEELRRQIECSIVLEDERVLILNKPAGIAVHGGSGLKFGLIETLRAARPKSTRLELVHRLDRHTSGCLIIAKDRETLRQLHKMLRDAEIDKRYLALLGGHWSGGKRKVTGTLRKNVQRSGERMVEVRRDGKLAISVFVPKKRYPDMTLVEINLATGRTHQIRVHAALIAHPVAGDEKYGAREFNRKVRGYGLKRMFLHASRLRFKLPWGDPVDVEAPLPQDLSGLLVKLQHVQ
ncbi:MAG: RluA family pseudouridine synthase [Gammaproteobacteria bacterium]|nr:RluA family pseudouridine synthase [Gammaproteobacteria bacterium]